MTKSANPSSLESRPAQPVAPPAPPHEGRTYIPPSANAIPPRSAGGKVQYYDEITDPGGEETVGPS